MNPTDPDSPPRERDGADDEPRLASSSASDDPRVRAALARYWRDNLRVMAALLALWAAGSFGCGILLADRLDAVRLPFTGFPLGFWFAHQGAIVVFVVCILLYCIAMNRLDRRHHHELAKIAAQS